MTAKKVRAQSPGPQGTSSQHVNIIEAIPPEETQPLAQVLNQPVPTTAQPVYTATSVPPLPPTPQMSSSSSSSHGTVIAYPDISQTSKILCRSPPPVPERSLDAAKTTPAILLVGLTGSGKSTLISHLTKAAVTIGHDLNSCTSEIATYTANIGGTVVRLIDTPGFDDTNRSDTDILSAIAVTLAMLYRERVPLLGVLYLHRISDTRVGGASRKCLRILENLAGQAAFGCILIATTMWDKVSPAEGDRREQELVLNPQFFGTLYNKGSGAKIMRHLGTRESARDIIKQIMTRWGGQSVVLQIQRQLVDEGLPLESTTAGRFVDAALREQQAKQHEEIKELEAALQECRDDSTLALLKEEHQAQLARVQELTTSRQGLRGNYKQLADRIIPSPENTSAEWERERESASREDSIAASEILALKEEVQMLKDQLRFSQDSQTEQEITLLTVKAEQRNQKYKAEAEVRRALQKAFEEKSAELVRMERHRERKRLESQRYGHGGSSISSHHHHAHGGGRGISTGERFLRWIAGPGYSVSMFG